MNQINRQGSAVTDSDWSLQVKKTVTFDGATANDPGDYDGTGNPLTLFTVQGSCLVRILAKCTVLLEGASATISVGTAATAAGLIASTTATNIDANEIWHDNSPDASVELSSVLTEKVVSDDIIQTVGTANITAGEIEYTVMYYPLTPDSSVVAA